MVWYGGIGARHGAECQSDRKARLPNSHARRPLLTQHFSRRAVLVGGVAALAGVARAGARPAAAQSLVGPLDGAPTLVMFHVEAGW